VVVSRLKCPRWKRPGKMHGWYVFKPMNCIHFHYQSPFSLLPFPSSSVSSPSFPLHPSLFLSTFSLPLSFPSPLPPSLFLPYFSFSGALSLKPDRGSGERCELPRRVPAEPGLQTVSAYYEMTIGLWWVLTALLKWFTDYELHKSQGRPKSYVSGHPRHPRHLRPWRIWAI